MAVALARVSDGEQAGRLGVADQYVATATATRVVARLGARFRRPGRSRGTVVLGAPRGERHSLPIAICADLVRLGGFAVLELGADVPADTWRITRAGGEAGAGEALDVAGADPPLRALPLGREPTLAHVAVGGHVVDPEAGRRRRRRRRGS